MRTIPCRFWMMQVCRMVCLAETMMCMQAQRITEIIGDTLVRTDLKERITMAVLIRTIWDIMI